MESRSVFDAAVEDAIISKETDCTIDSFVGEVVDVERGVLPIGVFPTGVLPIGVFPTAGGDSPTSRLQLSVGPTTAITITVHSVLKYDSYPLKILFVESYLHGST